MAWSRAFALALTVAVSGVAAAEPAQKLIPRGASVPPRQVALRPHGRMLIFWGCGEHAPPEQPLVVDFSPRGGEAFSAPLSLASDAPNPAAEAETLVFWTSAGMQAAGLAMADDPASIRCVVPQEVVDAAAHAVLQLVAYGPQADFVRPPGAPDLTLAWNRGWAVNVRYRGALRVPGPAL